VARAAGFNDVRTQESPFELDIGTVTCGTARTGIGGNMPLLIGQQTVHETAFLLGYASKAADLGPRPRGPQMGRW
jgi:hypothetical protein